MHEISVGRGDHRDGLQSLSSNCRGDIEEQEQGERQEDVTTARSGKSRKVPQREQFSED